MKNGGLLKIESFEKNCVECMLEKCSILRVSQKLYGLIEISQIVENYSHFKRVSFSYNCRPKVAELAFFQKIICSCSGFSKMNYIAQDRNLRIKQIFRNLTKVVIRWVNHIQI